MQTWLTGSTRLQKISITLLASYTSTYLQFSSFIHVKHGKNLKYFKGWSGMFIWFDNWHGTTLTLVSYTNWQHYAMHYISLCVFHYIQVWTRQFSCTRTDIRAVLTKTSLRCTVAVLL